MKCVLLASVVMSACVMVSYADDTASMPPLPKENLADPSSKRNNFRAHATKDHVLEELQHTINTKTKEDMTERELQFHYFKLHDFDNNNLLDGLEIVKALRHQHDEREAEIAGNTEKKDESEPAASDEEVIEIVDNVLAQDDANKDGYVSFYEFMAGNDNN